MSKEKFYITLSHGAGQRLDIFLAAHLSEFTRSQVQKLVGDQKVRLNGTWTKASHKLQEGDVIEIEPAVERSSPLLAEDIPLDILYGDEHVVVINKPAGLVVHPGAGVERGTLVNALLHHFPGIERVGHPERPGIVHRLDKETSGVMLVARSEAAYHELKRQFKAREVEKVYLALVLGRLQVEEGRMDWALGRDPKYRQKISIRSRHPRSALTLFTVQKVVGDKTLVEVKPVTGRTHQIRVHFAAAGHPIAGDVRYGGQDKRAPFPRLYLHAWHIVFSHPATKRLLEFYAPLPPEFQEIVHAPAVP